MKPITPQEVVSLKIANIPDYVIEVFNDLIAKGWNGSYSTVRMETAATTIKSHAQYNNERIYDEGWMDIEPLYRKAGWKVVFDKPGYNQIYDAYYTFSKGE